MKPKEEISSHIPISLSSLKVAVTDTFVTWPCHLHYMCFIVLKMQSKIVKLVLNINLSFQKLPAKAVYDFKAQTSK